MTTTITAEQIRNYRRAAAQAGDLAAVAVCDRALLAVHDDSRSAPSPDMARVAEWVRASEAQVGVHDHSTDAHLPGSASTDLQDASEAAGDTGAVRAYRDAEGVWQHVPANRADFVGAYYGREVRTVYVR